MINVNQITSQLAKMPDQALQKYAALNKNDPYILALAVAESNRRKEMRQAAQGAQGMMPQPKVADQAVQGMAPAQPMPEDMGIGRLPAGDMNFADGGIVAFADGGDVERYGDLGFTGFSYGDWAAADKKRRQQLLEEDRAKNMALVNADSGYAGRGLGILADPRVGAPGMIAPEAAEYDPALATRRVDYTSVPFDKTTPLRPGVSGAPGAPRTQPAPVEDKASTGLDALIKDFTRSTDLAQGALRNQRVGLAAQLEQEAKGAQEEGEQRRAARGDVYKAREERLAAREGDLAGMKDKHLGLALLQAGAAMMTTPGNLGMALGKGVQVGSERYMAGIDKINAAKEKFAEARDRLDDLRLNRDDMNEREIREENRAIRNARIQGQQLLTEGATKDLEMTTANMREFFRAGAENILADKRIASAERISANEIAARKAIAAVPGAQERIANLLGGGDIEKGLIRLTEIQAGKFNPQSAYAEYLSKRREGEIALSPVEFMTALRSVSALQGGAPSTSNKPTGKVFE